ncbi:polyamine-transporting ATPase 13A3 isoform X2 [Hydra vulgaris]|uniref:Cation-transporting ATPase n=2 Tax=Hydra vulgaris TaxID=6087 RepID=A0ABM4BKV9_HYDVU
MNGEFHGSNKIASSESVTKPKFDRFIVHAETKDEFSVLFYRRSLLFSIIFYILGICTSGIIFLIGYWYPIHRLKFTHNRCSIKEASSVRIKKSEGKQRFVCKIKTKFIERIDSETVANDFTQFEKNIAVQCNIRYFEFMFLRYIITETCDKIIPLEDSEKMWSFLDIRRCKYGITAKSNVHKLAIYNVNHINVPVKPYWLIFVQLSLDPFYIFQLFSVILWFTEDYTLYAALLIVLTFFSLVISTYQTKKAWQRLRDMISMPSEVKTLNRSVSSTISSYEIIFKSTRELVPGDVIIIPSKGMEVPCDVVLLSGRCIVNESSLTGESIPNNKTAIDDALESHMFYNINLHKQHTMFNGTNIIQARTDAGEENVLAVVIRTGFYTLKGGLIRSIMYPKPVHFTFFRDSMKFMLFISSMAVIGFIYTVIIFKEQRLKDSDIVKKALDLFTICVPPALPATMSVGLMTALWRLNSKDIFCIDPNRINVCGKIKLVVFDKTGTLTEDNLTVSCVIPAISGSIESVSTKNDSILDFPIFKAMATCHNLSIIDEQVSGDPIDMYMFNFTGCKLYDSNLEDLSKYENIPEKYKPHVKYFVTLQTNAKLISVLKHFTFDSALQRMSVITMDDLDELLHVYVKGSIDKILSMCIKTSIPTDIKKEIEKYTLVGKRVLAVANKDLTNVTNWYDVNKIPREEIESSLLFSGIIVFENVIKPGTHETIKMLSQANIKTIMATGDDLLTAAFIARDVNMVRPNQELIELSISDGNEVYRKIENPQKEKFTEEKKENSVVEIHHLLEYDLQSAGNKLKFSLALTGATYQTIHHELPHLLHKILVSGIIFARMSPNQKTMLVEDLQKIGYGVGMCGDGANDCGALKAAHAGIALSMAEASIAAPFTSKVFNISCVPILVMEGRAALATAFGTFKYMILYSMIQFLGIIILYSVSSSYSNNQFIYSDLGLNLPLVFSMTLSGASNKLIIKRPLGKLVHPLFISGIVLQVLFVIAFQLIAFFCIKKMPWYLDKSNFSAQDDIYFKCYENNAVVIVSYYLYIWLSLASLKGAPYRAPFYHNYVYTIVLSLTIAITLYLTIYPERSILNVMSLIESPSVDYPIFLIGIALCHLILALMLEKLLESRHAKKFIDWIRMKKEPRNKYKHILKEVYENQNWPPKEQTTFF